MFRKNHRSIVSLSITGILLFSMVFPGTSAATSNKVIDSPDTYTTIVLSNEGGGYLIDKLINAGYGDSCLYDVLKALQPQSDGVISDEFLATLAACPKGSGIFTAALSNFAGLNNPISVNFDGTIRINPIFGKDYYAKEGFATTNGFQPDVGNEMFTFTTSSKLYIDVGSSISNSAGGGTTNSSYKAFAIVWSSSDTAPTGKGGSTTSAHSSEPSVADVASPAPSIMPTSAATPSPTPVEHSTEPSSTVNEVTVSAAVSDTYGTGQTDSTTASPKTSCGTAFLLFFIVLAIAGIVIYIYRKRKGKA